VTPLTDEYLRDAEYRARRFSGAYTGTSGTLAADVLRMKAEILRQRDVIALLVGDPITPKESDLYGDRGRTNIAPGD
jgi:hypothetical protein